MLNNPVILTAIGLLLTALFYFLYIRWRRSPRGTSSMAMLFAFLKNRLGQDSMSAGSGKPSILPEGVGILSGKIRRPIREIRLMFGAWILLGIGLTVLSLILRSAVPEYGRRWYAFPFLILGLSAAVVGAYFAERLERASRVERAAAYLAHRLGVDLVQITCLAGGAVFFLLAAAARVLCGWNGGWGIIVVSAALGIILAVIGIWRPHLSRAPMETAEPIGPPADPPQPKPASLSADAPQPKRIVRKREGKSNRPGRQRGKIKPARHSNNKKK